jgi:putative tryptophan/tyrosine transport system substrate-binding protein
MRRREFLTLLGGAATAWPLVASAQQPRVPTFGFLDSRSPDAVVSRLTAFRQGLKEVGYVEGENIAIVYRWAENKNDRLPELAVDLVRRQVAVILAVGEPATFAAKAATTTIPTLFILAEDPGRLGLVSSLAHPGGKMTGINFLAAEVTTKRLEFLRQLVPHATRIAVLVNPSDAARAEVTLRDAEAAARTMGLEIQVLNADTADEIDSAFEKSAREHLDALFVAATPFLSIHLVQMAQLAAFYRLPAAHYQREFTEAGGLMSYGSDIPEAFRQAGVYGGRILKGEKPAELPVVQSSKFELAINVRTARMLGLTVPTQLLATADRVID